ncbi:Tll0287-like domain-containing protein [Brachymonas denitrificans]|uniref:Tll0287-like domain-containing protein n=1 Tax=Brachymonas denitrificans DSM 15123 TaxID=1121117 RepID=A0A1H8E0D5_9BURK|nr:DUF3365 domain-containing protein [Brachymonas denitrificans]SEN12886.1 Protein of unknown function [Brachymonas denitrificans DSM 15123]
MKTSALIIAAACVPFLSACNTSQPTPKQATATPAVEPWVADARAAASSVPPKLLAVLQPAIKERGPAGAIDVCSKEAPKLAKAASEQTGWQIRRVSLKNRNPKAVPDAWERATLESFDKAQAAGVDPAMLERAEVVVENGQSVRRYMRALPVQQACLQCHGTADKLGAGVAQKLTQLYPNDKGTGYTLGQIRGAMTLRQPVAN